MANKIYLVKVFQRYIVHRKEAITKNQRNLQEIRKIYRNKSLYLHA